MDKKQKINLPAEIVGWYGMSAIVLAYLLVSFDFIDAESYIYQLLNLTGAAGVIIISLVKNVRQSVVLNLFWATIAALALLSLVLN